MLVGAGQEQKKCLLMLHESKEWLVYSGREGRNQKKRGHQNVIYEVLHLLLVMAVLEEVTIPILFTAESP